jgi:hypothetical protein
MQIFCDIFKFLTTSRSSFLDFTKYLNILRYESRHIRVIFHSFKIINPQL